MEDDDMYSNSNDEYICPDCRYIMSDCKCGDCEDDFK